MKAITTPFFSNFLINDLKDQFANQSNTYVTLGKIDGTGANNANVEDVIFSTNKKNEFYRNMVGAKKITASDMQPVVSRRDWANNIVYDAYEDHIEIFSYIDLYSLGTANANANTVLAGNANIAASNVVVGNGTSFLTYVFPGDQIRINSATKTVVSVTNNQHLIVNSAFANTNTRATITLLSNSTIIVANSANFIGNVETGNVVIVNNDQTTAKQIVAVRSNKVIALNTPLTISVSNTQVQRLDNTYPATANNFYVRNTKDQVFKCLFNANGTASVIEPTIDIDGQLPENPFILTADGYKWKYLYTIPTGLKQKFFTNRWMPAANDLAVTTTAVDGRLDIINVLWGGSGYLEGGNSNTAAILQITATDGQGANLYASVTNGNISSVTIITGGNNYTRGTVSIVNGQQLGSIIVGGTVNVTGTLVSANLANTSNQSFLGNVFTNDIITVNNQSRNVVTVINSTALTVNTSFTNAESQIASVVRSNAVFDLQIGPQGGHGSNPAEELRAHSLMITVEFNGDENSTVPISDNTQEFDFNQIGILSDPLVANGAFTANAVNYRTSTRLGVSTPGGITNFQNGEAVYVGELSNPTAIANVAHFDVATNYVYINNITGTFVEQQVLKGANTGISLPILSVSNSEFKMFSGDLLYMENRSNVIRKDDQIDQIKIVLSF